jgi:hypothetical protein
MSDRFSNDGHSGNAYSGARLAAFLDEALPPAEMAALEDALRSDALLAQQLAMLCAERDAGVHSLGAIWRRRRLTCPSRERLGSYLLGVLDEGESRFIKTHLELVECRPCRANVEDLARQQTEAPAAMTGRQRKYFQSSAGRLPRAPD